MKSRRAAVIFMVSGVALLVVSGWRMTVGGPMWDWAVPLGIGAIFLVIGLALFVTELFETWLSRGQRALVDGLQAG